jgi:hypothetical protein
MLSFFEKSGDIHNEVNYYLKYNIDIPDNVEFHISLWEINKKYDYRLNEILPKTITCYLDAYDIKRLPNNINNQKLSLLILKHNEVYNFPENCSINRLEFLVSSVVPKFNETFKYKENILSFEQKKTG